MIAVRSPQVDARYRNASPDQKAFMARFDRNSTFSLARAYTPKLNLNLGMDSGGSTPPPVGHSDFNNDFNNDFGPP